MRAQGEGRGERRVGKGGEGEEKHTFYLPPR